MNAKHVLALACAACAAASLAQGAVAAQSPGSDRFHPASAEQARASSIQMVAKSFGLTPAAAASRMNVEEHAPDIVERIRTQYANRLAGVYIEHAPTHRLVVRLTGFSTVPREFYQFGNDQLVVDYKVGAEYTLANLQKRFERGFAGLKERLPQLQSGYVDERTGELVLEVVNDQPKATDAKLATASETAAASNARVAQQQLATNYFGVATRVASIGRIANQAIRGSGNLDATGVQCTGAFTVKSVSTPVTYGLLTAGHCQATTLNYTEVNTTTPITGLSWVAAKNDASSDIGWASISTTAADAVKSFYNGSMFVTPALRLTKAGTSVGMTLCHYGRSTVSKGGVCGTVGSTAYSPGSICGSSGTGLCSPTFVAVDVSISSACQPEDSGGNWYSTLNQPAGVHKAGDVTTGRCVYTSTDDIIGGTLNLQFL
jgi:hypothetical protein